MSEPTHSIYCQLGEDVNDNSGSGSGSGGSDEDDDAPQSKEIIIEPKSEDGANQTSCQELFDSFSTLISLNPMEDDEDDAFGSGGGGGFSAMLGMMANAYGGDESDDDDDDDDDEMICRIDPSQMITAQEGRASSEERKKMLERLDNVLVVPSEYELDGQFDDAEEELDSGDKEML